MTKTLLFFFIIINLFLPTLLTPIKTVNAQSTEIIFNPSKIQVAEQSNFTVQIQTLNAPQFIMFWITINYNTTVMDALNASTWQGGYINIDEDQGTIDLCATTLQPLEGNQTLATIIFKAIKSSNSTLQFTNTQIDDPQNNPIPHTTETAQIEIVGPINLTLQTSKQSYYLGENVTVYGNSTVEDSPISSLVGLEIWTREGPKLTRIANSSYIPSTTEWPVNIINFYPSDEYGNPTSGFTAGYQAYFTITVQNLKDENLPILIVINVFDMYKTIIGFTIFQGTIFKSSQIMFIGPVLIQKSAFSGTATAYVNIFSDWPKNQGIPYYPEKAVNFQITGGSTGTPPTFPPSNQVFSAQFNITFRLPPTGGLAKWEVYATTAYKIQTAITKASFVAANLFVDDDKPADFNSIQSAINAANDTNTIYVYNGTYYENIKINKTISIVGENAEATIIDGRKLDIVVNITKSNAKVFDMKIINSGATPPYDTGIGIFSYSCKVVGCIVTNNSIGIKVQNTESAYISQNTINTNNYGIMIIDSNNSDITENSILNNSYGIFLSGTTSVNTEIENGIIISNNFGIYLLNSSYATITGSLITNNTYGLTLTGISCNYNEISNSHVSLNTVGITLNSSRYNKIDNSNISCNLNYGIWINGSDNNQIYSNNFINNTNHVYALASANQWNSSYPQGGNYWDNYNGIDEKYGPNQDQLGSDGIGDTPHQVSGLENVDYYPLMKPPFIQDIGITNIFLSKTLVAKGYPMRIYVRIVNYGSKQQNFNLTVYLNGTCLNSQVITISGRNFTVVTFWWNTTGATIGNYTTSAYASTLEYEADLTNNNLIGSEMIKVWPLAADFNADGRVNAGDFYLLARAYGATPSSPRWNPNIDVNEDGKIGPYDFYILSKNYGKNL